MTNTPTSMRAVVLDAPGPPEALQIRDLSVPTPEVGQVLITLTDLETSALPGDRFAFAVRADGLGAHKTIAQGWLLDARANAADRSTSCAPDHFELLGQPTSCAPAPSCGPVDCEGAVTLRPCGRAVTVQG